jgi:CBS domain containing-hemolysin-like protein
VFSDSGYSRLPIYDGDIDNILGIVYYKDFFNEAFGEGDSIVDISKPIIYVAKAQKINDLLKELQNKQMHMAVVLDEYGSTAGIVTLEDILEEIVGEIWDEHDEKVEEIQQISEKEYIVSGMASISKVLDTFDIDEEPDSPNANGWAMEVLGKMPEVGDTFEEYGLAVEILETNGKRVEHLKIVDVRESDEDDEDDDKKSDEDEKDD